MKKTALIILNYNNAADTRNCVDSVLKHNTAPVKIVVVDNGSNPEELAALQGVMTEVFGPEGYADRTEADGTDILADVTLLRLPKNVGYACGNNAGLELAYADADVDQVMVLNNDILFTCDVIPPLIEALEATPDCAIISPLLYQRDGTTLEWNCARRNVRIGELVEHHFLSYIWRAFGIEMEEAQPDHFLLKAYEGAELPRLLPIELPSGSCMLVDKKLFREIGSFDPYTFLYYEENILYKRIQALGLRNYLLTSVSAIHLGGATTTTRLPSKFHMATSLRSERYYVKEYSGASRMMRWAYNVATAYYHGVFKLIKLFRRC